jgi:propanol-preferring alcohol dehydrogenase
MIAFEGPRPDLDRPVVPGHEIVGIIDAVGSGVSMWRPGERVGVGYLGGHCGVCERCRRGQFASCTDQPATRSDVDGGYAQYVYARARGVVRVPGELAAIDASPLLCARLTTYKGLLRTAARPGTLIAVQGIGGLGHLGLRYAAKLGYRVAAIARGADKADLAVQLGADYYIDSEAENPAPLGVATVFPASSSRDLDVRGFLPRRLKSCTRSDPDRSNSSRFASPPHDGQFTRTERTTK